MAEPIRVGGSFLGSYGTRVAAGIGATGALIGKGQGYLSKSWDGITALPGIVNYFPNMFKDADRVKRISEGIHTASESKDEFLRAQGLLEQAYNAIGEGFLKAETKAERALHYAGEAAEQVGNAGIRLFGNLKAGLGKLGKVVESASEEGIDGILNEGVLDRAGSLADQVYNGVTGSVADATREIHPGTFRSAGRAVKGSIEALVDGGREAYVLAEKAMNEGYAGLQQVQEGITDVAKVMAEVDYNGILQAVEQTGSNLANQPASTVAAVVSMLAAGEVASRGIRLYGKRGQGSVFDELDRKSWKKIFGKSKKDELELEKFGVKDVVRGGLAQLTDLALVGVGYVGAAGAAISAKEGYVGKLKDAFMAPINAFNYSGQIGEDASNLSKAASALAKTPEHFEALKGKLSLLDLKGSYHALQEAAGQIGQSVEYATIIHGNKMWDAVGNFTDNVVEQPGKTAAAIATAVGAGYLLGAASQFVIGGGEGTILDKAERRLGKKIWPSYWKKKLAAENAKKVVNSS